MPHLETAALGVWAGVGGRDEKPNEHGISHLLEHMAFKGTTRRSSREIVEEIEAVGGDLNAGTSTETTAYYARVMKADVPLALDVLSDILANPSFVPDELEREKSVIVQEIGAAQDTPDDVVFEHLNELCFPDQPMGRSLLGTAKTLKKFDRDMLRGYLSTALSRPRHGGRGRRRGRPQARGGGSRHKNLPASTPRRRRSRCRDVRQGRLARGASRPRTGASDAGARGRAADAICRCSRCRSSPTRSAAGCRRGCSRKCAKSAACATRSTPSTRPIPTPAFSASIPAPIPADAPEMMEVIVDVINDAVETLTEAEIARAKAQMKAGLLMALESCSSPGRTAGAAVLAYGRPQTVEELVARIDAVSVESTRNAAHALLDPQPAGGCRAWAGQGSGHGGVFCGRIDQVEGEDALH